MIRRRLIVRGRVQGVFYRATAREEARRLGLVGWVRNLSDGGVEIIVEGAAAAIEALIDWSRRGPPHARVDSLDIEEEEPLGDGSSFEIRY